MCRFTMYLGPEILLSSLVTEPANSVIHQSFHSHLRDEPLNGDGFGVAWYAPEIVEEPATFRSVSPAWNNANLLSLARVVRSRCILAHVRAATQGLAVSEANCHPFTAGRLAFMHNGDLGGFAAIRRRLIGLLSDEAFSGVRGSTDSEHVFAWFRDRLAEQRGDDAASRLADAVRDTVRGLVELGRTLGEDEPSYLNLAVTDGRVAVASRFTTDAPENADSLFLNRGRRYVCDGGVCRMLSPEEGGGAVLVSSEPLSEEPGWETIPVNHLAIVREDRSLELAAV
jgi:predicted glutamine amidotransferase